MQPLFYLKWDKNIYLSLECLLFTIKIQFNVKTDIKHCWNI